ncbi:hypothetical protein METP3_03720 [Methanosarcinales archaeon]|nr:hypothetical protein METP3_03720 [Methanosarcinales archaeon]
MTQRFYYAPFCDMEDDGEMIKNDSRGKNMIKRKYFKGIAILVLILGMLSVAMAITITSPPADLSVSNITGDPARIFTITVSGNSTVTWLVNGTVDETDSPNTIFSYTNSTFEVGIWNVTAIARNSTNGSDIDMRKWLWTVTAAPPSETAPIITPSPTAIAFDTSANISFIVNQSNARTNIRYGISSLDSESIWQNGSSYGNSRNILLTGLSPGNQYFYSVFAYNDTNLSLFSNSTPIQTFTTRNPTKPNITSVTNDAASTSSINFTIVVNQTDAYIGIKYGETELLELPFIWNNASGSPRTIKLSPLASGTKYYYSVYAFNQTNQTFSSNTTIQNFTTKYPGPTIGTINPSNTSALDMTTGESRNLSITIGSQSGNLSWYENNNTSPLTSKSVNASETVIYSFSRSTKGTYKITANVSNANGSDTRVWTINVHPATFSTGNRIWDGSKPDEFGLTYTWTPQSFSGFYYNAKDDVGTENITITMASYSSRTIGTNKLVYSTSPQEVSFTHSAWGKYEVIGFMADKYFAGYTSNTSSTNTRPTTTFAGVSALAQGGLHKVLIDDDTKQTIAVGGTLALRDGYVLKATDIDLNARTMLLSLLKDGSEVDVLPLSAGETYVYTKTIGGVESLPLIMIRFDSVFSGQELQVAFIKGLFQISEDTTVVRAGDKFGNMEVDTVDLSGIQMTNSANIGLNKATTATVMGDLKIQVANNDSAVRFALTVDRPSNLEVRSTVYKDGNPREWTPYNFGMNIGDTSFGFYYDLDEGVGSEKLTLTNPVSGRSIPADGLEYSTAPQEVKFTYNGFGKYQAIGFMADRYFAGYTSNTLTNIITRPTTDFDGISTIANGNLNKVLIDDDTKTTIAVGSTIALQEGYVLKATDIDLNARAMLLTLLKDGTEVDVTPLSAGETYIYTKTIGGTENLPLIMVRFENVFSGQELQVAFLRGIFQISENPTKIEVGNQFGSMEVTSVQSNIITMSNSGSIGLSKNTNNALMGNIKLKVADNDALRFYFAVDVTPEMIVNQLSISAPTKVMAGDTLKVKVTAGGKAVSNASLSLDTDIGTTDNNGELNYTIPKTLKAGTYTITAAKTGYEKATKSIEIEKYVDLRLSIEAPSNANQYETITIKVLYNGTAMSGATVLFDNTSAGTTDSNGEVSYRLETSGTHTITASKASYITVSTDIDIRAPYSEFRALDINITPNPVFAGDDFVVRSNITNVGTKSDTLPVDLVINGTAVDNRTITLTPGQKVEINFTRQEPLVTNVTVQVIGQSDLLVVQKKPRNYLLIAAIATAVGAVIIYVLTSKGLLSVEILKQKFGLLSDKFSNLFKK